MEELGEGPIRRPGDDSGQGLTKLQLATMARKAQEGVNSLLIHLNYISPFSRDSTVCPRGLRFFALTSLERVDRQCR
jgi:hypothetical protein